ncbi:MAG: hypothetical protein CUN55_13530, partial [Phototrophicales bacterium]
MNDPQLEQAQRATAISINQAMTQNQLTHMEIGEIAKLSEEIGRLLPAGNVIKMVFSQLRSAKGRRVSTDESKRMMGLLQQGISTILDRASYMTFYTTPAILIAGYQMLLKAAGQDPDTFFPNGVWQFYLEFGLREDTARHACETIGFQNYIAQQRHKIDDAEQLTACVMAASDILVMYNDLLATEWRERRLLYQLGQKLNDPRMVHRWLALRPYDVPDENTDYLKYRKQVFAKFERERLMTQMTETGAEKTISQWQQEETLNELERIAYQRQMTILATLQPSTYSDERIPIPPESCYIGIIWHGHYHLIPIYHQGQRLSPEEVLFMVQQLTEQTIANMQANYLDEILIHIPRSSQAAAREKLPENNKQQIELLKQTPILINWDMTDANASLARIRQNRRGIGDHALTIFRTQSSLVFDQSHIFFDATWGMAIAEIFTNLASRHLSRLTQNRPKAKTKRKLRPITLQLRVSSQVLDELSPYINPLSEISAESISNVVPQINYLRRLLIQRNAHLKLTVNDFLILYRSIYNQVYRPSKILITALNQFGQQGHAQKQAAENAKKMLNEISDLLPAILIPIDASPMNPSARLFPITFCPHDSWRTTLEHHQKTLTLLQTYQQEYQEAIWKKFSNERTTYLQLLMMFGLLMQRYKEIALEGHSFSTVTLKILAGVPKRLQKVLRDIPDHIDLLNDMLKGTEVFSNVGRVADNSSLWRFITAKDDNHKKELCWGIMTRADDTM